MASWMTAAIVLLADASSVGHPAIRHPVSGRKHDAARDLTRGTCLMSFGR
jgi:hypothetical protein